MLILYLNYTILSNICQQESDLKERFKGRGYGRESGTLKPKKLIKKAPVAITGAEIGGSRRIRTFTPFPMTP
jgi:hypothetical protein